MTEMVYHIPFFGHITLDLPVGPPQVSLQSHIPGLCEDAAPQPDFWLTYDPAETGPLREETGRMVLGGAWSPARTDDIPHLLYAIARRHWIENRIYPLHAAAATGKSGKAVLLAGPSGVGKTTLCDALVGRAGWKFVSGNKTLISFSDREIGILAATTTHSVLQPDGSRTQMQVDVKKDYPIDVSAIVIPYLNDGAENWRQLSPLSAMHMLFPLCLDAMNADVLIDAGAVLYSGSVSTTARRHLGLALQKALAAIPVYRGVGSLEVLCTKIEALP